MPLDRRTLESLTPEQLLDEIALRNALIEQVASAPRRVAGWDKFVWSAGVGLVVLGVITSGPLTIVPLLVSGGGLLLIGADAAKKLSEIKGDVEIRALLARLRDERTALETEYRRR